MKQKAFYGSHHVMNTNLGSLSQISSVSSSTSEDLDSDSVRSVSRLVFLAFSLANRVRRTNAIRKDANKQLERKRGQRKCKRCILVVIPSRYSMTFTEQIVRVKIYLRRRTAEM
ncbi:hypothetical protein PHLCEN_2v8126 [Hermanssonia centrifuga]|uniref:Uncharacterized protein n=1 Tax=Hermanssonia centrifuga TaxID=98765 RepID=A0A2R6NV64_9APHY|nr:hypothetical protein PHLCEN_2v8126 [Hermanssonia centrifuga]